MPSTALGLLDFIMREYFQTNRLDVSLQTLRNAFDKARILPRHLKPGYGVWDLTQETESGILFSSLDEDLRLPGVFLSSFVEFGSSYYAWYKIADETPSTLNRHAIMHCASKYWAPHNAARLLTFLDLSLRLDHQSGLGAFPFCSGAKQRANGGRKYPDSQSGIRRSGRAQDYRFAEFLA